MKEFFIGLLVIMVMLLLTIVGLFLLPFIVILGFILKWLIFVMLVIVGIWLIGWTTLQGIDYTKNREK